jgi:hypothetical protein
MAGHESGNRLLRHSINAGQDHQRWLSVRRKSLSWSSCSVHQAWRLKPLTDYHTCDVLHAALFQKLLKILNSFKKLFKRSHYMFWPIWPSSSVTILVFGETAVLVWSQLVSFFVVPSVSCYRMLQYYIIHSSLNTNCWLTKLIISIYLYILCISFCPLSL